MGEQQRATEPMTQLAEAAVGLHETFRTLTESGFTEWQACRIIGVMLAELGRQQ